MGIDVGTTGAKAALVDVRGNVQAVCHSEYEVSHIRPTWVEQNPEDWWRAFCAVVQECLAKVPLAADRIAGLAVSSQGPTLLPLDRSGRPVRPAVIWMDRRAEMEACRLAQVVGSDQIYEISGNRPDPFFLAARFLWMKIHEPELFAQTAIFVQINGYINYRLTGCCV